MEKYYILLLPRKRKRVDSSGDRISELPLDLRLHILSFLTTKSAVRTGALSKRWARLWASSPNLLFDQMEFPTTTPSSFVSFVDAALRHLASEPCNITRFQVRWLHCFDAAKLASWLDHAAIHGVREIALTISLNQNWTPRDILAPATLFCSQSLHTLNIRTETLPLALPNTITLPRLKHLVLKTLVIHTQMLGRLIHGCPVLETLHIAVFGHGVVHASAPNLTLLLLHCLKTDGDSRIRISAPRLQRLSYAFTWPIPEIDLGELPCLSIAQVRCGTYRAAGGSELMRIITSLSNVKTLVLSKHTIEILSLVPDLPKHMQLRFCLLKNLDLRMLVNKKVIRVIVNLLTSFTNLEELVIHNSAGPEFWSDVSELENNQLLQKLDCHCNLIHLKKVEINGFFGSTDELNFVEFVLQRASTLQTMILNYKKELHNQETWFKICECLCVIPRTSSTAQVVLSSVS